MKGKSGLEMAIWFAVGSILCGVGVLFGAFGAHGLRGRIDTDMLAVFETGVRYHLIHGLGVIAVAFAMTRWPSAGVTSAGWLFVVGIVIFSGSLYLMAVTNARWLGAITPIGGLCFLMGWGALAVTALRGSS